MTEIGLNLETRIWIAVDTNHDTLRFHVDADSPALADELAALVLSLCGKTQDGHGENHLVWIGYFGNYQTSKPLGRP